MANVNKNIDGTYSVTEIIEIRCNKENLADAVDHIDEAKKLIPCEIFQDDTIKT